MNPQLDDLFSILSNESFLSMRGLANEVPIFIQPYEVRQEDQVAAMIRALAQRLRTSGIKVAEVDLFRLLLEELKAEDLLDAFTDEDADYDPMDLLRDLKNYADPKGRIVPRLVKIMEEEGCSKAPGKVSAPWSISTATPRTPSTPCSTDTSATTSRSSKPASPTSSRSRPPPSPPRTKPPPARNARNSKKPSETARTGSATPSSPSPNNASRSTSMTA